MRTPLSKTCQNCNAENQADFKYCTNCGQKNTDGKITFSELWSEFQDAVFNIESRTWRTFKNLFIPGKLTLEYFLGKHRQYVHPLRLLIVTSVLFIIAMSFQDFQSATNHGYNIKERILRNYERQRIYGILKNITDSTNAIFPVQQTEIITDTLLTAFKDSMRYLLFKNSNEFANRYGDKYGDSINLNQYANFGPSGKENVSKYDFLHMDEDELVDTYKKEASSIDRLFFTQKAKLIKDESQLFKAVIGHSTWAILLLMPCLALVLYFLYFRHSCFYVEHLIFTFHFQSFLFLVLAVLIAGIDIYAEWILLPCIIITGIYLLISMWRVYRQSIAKTLFKFLILSICYCSLFILILIGTIYASFLLL